MKCIPTKEAVGHVLCHDMTQIIKDVKKDTVFRKGHIVREEDIPVLLSIGKEHLYVWEKQEGMLHENDAAEILCQISRSENMARSEVKEGKIELIAEIDGLLKVDAERLEQVNALDGLMIATRPNNTPVHKGDRLAGMRIIPLVIEEERMEKARQTAGEAPLLRLLPYQGKKAGIVTTGAEVFSGRIQDAFGPVLREKLGEFGVEVLGQKIVPDDLAQIKQGIQSFLSQGADLVLCTGGMSVDPDDLTPTAIQETGAEIITYGAPVLPGAMFLLAYTQQGVPIVGLPGCVMYAKRTIFDLVLPRLMAGERLCKGDFAKMGLGGFCLSCEVCTFPNCGFGACAR